MFLFYFFILFFITQAFEELERLLLSRGVCVAVKEKLTKDSGVAGAGDYNHIVEKLQAKPKARGKIPGKIKKS